MRAKDIMTPCSIVVSPDTPVAAIARVLVDYHISGVPVVDGDKVVGIVSEGDLMRRAELGTDKRRRRTKAMCARRPMNMDGTGGLPS